MEGVTTISIPWSLFDVFIVAFLVVAAAVAVEAVHKFRQKHARRMRWAGIGALAVIGWLVIFYGSFIEPKILVLRDVHLRFDDAAEAVEHPVAIVSDIHVGPYKKAAWARQVVEAINDSPAEYVLMPGDFIFHATEEVELLAPFADLQIPAYAVLGNHDQEFADADAVASRLEDFGIQVLRNESVELPFLKGGAITVAGIDDVWFSADPEAALADADPSLPLVLLSHNPDYILDDTSDRVDLVISGHTHCGQIRLPGIGPVPPLPTKLGRQYDCGLYGYGSDSQLYITPGVGETGPRARLFNPPTIDIMHMWMAP